MPAAARLNDPTTGHGCFPSTVLNSASSNVIINGKGSVRLKDTIESHCCVSCHSDEVSAAASKVFVNGRNKARVGDPISCGDAIKSGSGNVFVN